MSRSTRSCQKVAEQLVESPRSGYISYAFSFYCLFILFITNTFPCLCASSSFAHLSSVLVESHSSASVLRESLQLLFFLDVSMHLHFIKQSGYPKLFELTRISKLPWSWNLFSDMKINAGMWMFCNNCQELEQSKNGLFSCTIYYTIYSVLKYYLKKIVTINTTSLAILVWILY